MKIRPADELNGFLGDSFGAWSTYFEQHYHCSSKLIMVWNTKMFVETNLLDNDDIVLGTVGIPKASGMILILVPRLPLQSTYKGPTDQAIAPL
jgi:hypothetical protein